MDVVVKAWVRLIRAGRKTLEDISDLELRELVRQALNG